MKSRRLTETDLANMAFESAEIKRMRLMSLVKPKKIIGSYEPFRSSIGDALNEQFPFLLEERQPTSLERLVDIIAKSCRGNANLVKMNVEVATATHTFAAERDLTAERLDVRPITLVHGQAYTFSMPLLMRYGGVACAAFPDMRRTSPLTAKGCHVVFSMMHQRLRANYPDRSELQLQIWRYANNNARTIRQVICSDTGLIPYDELVADVTESYAILHAILEDQDRERRRGGGAAGPLFGLG